MVEYKEIEQDPDVSDGEMMDIIREHLSDGWSLVEYKWDQGLKIWVFQFG